MTPVALDGTKLIVLMAAGGIFALAGLWLIFCPAAAGADAAKIELFGFKFQSSSAGLLVFLIGAVFLAVPIFVPERAAPPSIAAEPETTASVDSTGTTGRTASQKQTGAIAVVLPTGAGANEAEPNGFVTEANQIDAGLFYSGAIEPTRRDHEDWFVIPKQLLAGSDLQLQVRTRGVSGIPGFCHATVLDDREREVETWDFAPVGSSGHYSAFLDQSEFALIRIWSTGDYACQYQLKAG